MWRNTQERSIYVYTHSYNIWCSLSSTLQESKAERWGSSVYVQVVKLSQQWQQLLFLLKAVGSRLKDTRARIERGRQGKLVQTFFFCFAIRKKQSTVLLGLRGLSWLILESCALSGKKAISIHTCTLSVTNSFCCLHQIIKKPHRNKQKKNLSDNLLKLLSAHHFSFPPGYIGQTLCIDLNLGDLTMTDWFTNTVWQGGPATLSAVPCETPVSLWTSGQCLTSFYHSSDYQLDWQLKYDMLWRSKHNLLCDNAI